MSSMFSLGPGSSAVWGGNHFPSPFNDMAGKMMPDNIKNALQLCEFVFNSMGTYRQAMERVNSYFLTKIEIGSAQGKVISQEEKDKYDIFLNDILGGLAIVQTMLRDRACYGNAFASVLVPFKRLMICPQNNCGTQIPLSEIADKANEGIFRFRFENCSDFVATCPRCKFRGAWKIYDLAEKDESKLRIKHWSPHEIEILHCPYTDQCRYLWRIPEDYKREIRAGTPYFLERASQEVIKAIKNNQLFCFDDNVIYHMREPVVSGLQTRGWGLSRVLMNFRQIWYVQVLRRYNEAIALDYVIPFRLITPESRNGSSAGGGVAVDPLLSIGMGDFMGSVRKMIGRRARDPAGWHTLPYPVKYQVLGGDASQLAPRDLLDQGYETLLNEAGTPVELYRSSLTLQTAPVALRLFEATWHHQVHDINDFLSWLAKQLSQILSWEAVTASMKKVTYADDMNRQMALLQLMMGQSISGTTALKSFDINWRDEQRQLSEEARFQQEQQAVIQEEMDQAAFGQQIAKGQGAAGGGQQGAPAGQGGGAPADPAAAGGGMPAPGPVSQYVQSMGPNTPVTPQDMMAQAQSLAQQLLGLPESQKDSELRMLKQKNEVLHSLVRANMDKIRHQARMQGGSMVMQQQFGGGG